VVSVKAVVLKSTAEFRPDMKGHQLLVIVSRN
jgi:hypothetical protein